MNRETARQEIRNNINCEKYLEKSTKGLYCCPFCGSGTGKHKTGALKLYDTNTWTCHKCHKSGDVIDLYQKLKGVDYNSALSLLAQEINITITENTAHSQKDPLKRPRSDFFDQGSVNIPLEKKVAQKGVEPFLRASNNFTVYYLECKQRINNPEAEEYLKRRGISIQTAKAYGLGYDPKADTAKSGHICPRIIIPTSKNHYIGRRIDGTQEFAKLNPKGSTPAIFNSDALYAQEVQEVFVTEGAFDALSVIEVGAAAIALNSAANADVLIKQLEQRSTQATLILCLDNDQSGQKATQTLKTGLKRLNIGFVIANISAGYKDPNQALVENREEFIKAIEQAKLKASAKPDNTAYYIDSFMNGEIEKFQKDKKTGFKNLDELAGGLYSGLYVLAAISSLGKTSFALQLADQLATNGNDVIFFSLEQSKLELVSKSLARRTAQKSLDNAVSSLSIRKGCKKEQVMCAANEYKQEVQDRISIIEGNFNCNISFIGDYIRQYVNKNNTKPVVFVDYLQILQPSESAKRQSMKENVDNSVVELRRISRELDLTVIVISSVNRTNYLTPIDFESLKESGGIEYTADVIWGLQLKCLSDPVFNDDKKIKERRDRIKQAKTENPRRLELSCLKNRYGIANYSCYFEYYPANDLFKECSSTEFDFTEVDSPFTTWDDIQYKKI